MNRQLAYTIIKTINLSIGTKEAMAILAAIEIAEVRWQPKDEMKYGTEIMQMLTGAPEGTN